NTFINIKKMTAKHTDFFSSLDKQPHVQRCHQILKKHPEIAKLMGRNPATFGVLLLIVALQFGIAFGLGMLGFAAYWWAAIIAAYCIGAFANHSLYVIIHEATHNLIFKNKTANRLSAILADFPNVVPASMSFRTYHLKHHAHQGEHHLDADLPSDWEAKMVGNSTLKKALWMLFFPVFQIFRVPRLESIKMWDSWTIANAVIVIAFDVAVVYFVGWNALFYLGLSMLFGLGLHPLGARWIQEHYTLDSDQETFSYYGPLNKLAMNVGYHNEHHDFPSIPWNRLPQVRAAAPEFYDTLEYHTSWSRLLWNFITDTRYSLYSRVLR
ncbi:MAG: fatty acid desaturase, partial [Bacteroidota bacterium]